VAARGGGARARDVEHGLGEEGDGGRGAAKRGGRRAGVWRRPCRCHFWSAVASWLWSLNRRACLHKEGRAVPVPRGRGTSLPREAWPIAWIRGHDPPATPAADNLNFARKTNLDSGSIEPI
jgi:hypothetical protein